MLNARAGGAEKLVVEVALTLQRRGHQVQIYTAFHDSSEDRCFQATRDGMLLIVMDSHN
jgi:alpha-1,3/alpha-1,6-mannosyltransferase